MENDKHEKDEIAKEKSTKKRVISIITFVLIFFILIGIISFGILYFRLRSAYDPDSTFSERSGDYSVPLEYTGDDLIQAESFDESDWDDDLMPGVSHESDVSNVPAEESLDISDTNSGSGNSSGGGNWVWRPKNTPIIKKEPINSEIVNVMVIGVDSKDGVNSGGRTDTMIVASYNKKTGVINLISLLRDSFVPIEGHNWNRLNTGYFFGGIGLCINTVNDVFLLDIQHYVMVDFTTLPKLIDKIGGIEIELSKAEVDYYNSRYNWNVKQGTVLLNGSQALVHARNRSVGNADFARTSRQRDLLTKIIYKMLDKDDLTGTISTLNTSLDLIKTNLTPTALIGLATNVFTGPKVNVAPMRMPVDGSYAPYWYQSNMLVTKIDIQMNRDAIRKAIYG